MAITHSRQSWHKPVHIPVCLGRSGRSLRIRQGCPRRRSRRKSHKRRGIPGHYKWMRRNRKVLRQWAGDARTRITLGRWVVHAAMHWQVHEWLIARLSLLWLRWRRQTQATAAEPSPPNIHASCVCTEATAQSTTIASAARSKFGWPGPKSGLRALIIITQSMLY